MYVHGSRYPSAAPQEHDYALGDVPESVMLAFASDEHSRMRETLTDANPFQYERNEDVVKYFPHF